MKTTFSKRARQTVLNMIFGFRVIWVVLIGVTIPVDAAMADGGVGISMTVGVAASSIDGTIQTADDEAGGRGEMTSGDSLTYGSLSGVGGNSAAGVGFGDSANGVDGFGGTGVSGSDPAIANSGPIASGTTADGALANTVIGSGWGARSMHPGGNLRNDIDVTGGLKFGQSTDLVLLNVVTGTMPETASDGISKRRTASACDDVPYFSTCTSRGLLSFPRLKAREKGAESKKPTRNDVSLTETFFAPR